jgi:hypothetical protein
LDNPIRFQPEGRKRDLAMFNLAIDCRLRGCDLLRVRSNDVCAGWRTSDVPIATYIVARLSRQPRFRRIRRPAIVRLAWIWMGDCFMLQTVTEI